MRREIRALDYFLILIVIAIVTFSLVSIGNAMAPAEAGEKEGFAKVLAIFDVRYVRLQTLWFAAGLALMLIVTFAFDYQVYGKLYMAIYVVNVLMLAVLLIMEKATRGAVSWFKVFGDRGIQPSEFAKIAIIIFLAKALSKYDGRITKVREVFVPLLLFVVPFILIVMQPDLGTAMVYIAILIGMLFVAGINWKLMLMGLAGAAVAIPFAWQFILTNEQRSRIQVYFNVSGDVNNEAYHLAKSEMAIGSGQMWGKGLFASGSLSQLDYVPDQHTDFIFSVTAEAFGFVGAAILIGLYLLLIGRLIFMAAKTEDRFGQLLITGVMSMFFFHVFQNIGMTMGLMPITGIPLPLMSYGGSSMWTNMIALGLVLNVYCKRTRIRYDKEMLGFEYRADSPR